MTVADVLAALATLDPSSPVILIGPASQRWEVDYIAEEALTGAVVVVARPDPLS